MTDFHPTEAFPSAITKGSLGARLCENAHEATMRRIVFSIASSR